MPAALNLDELGELFEHFSALTSRGIDIGVRDPEVARYARVLEYGSIVGQKPWPRPGPRTLLAVDPETGAQVVVSAQAPQGFIRARVPEFVNCLRNALARPAEWLDPEAVQAHLEGALRSAASLTLATLREGVPGESGRLSQNLEVIGE